VRVQDPDAVGGGGSPTGANYRLISTQRTFRVNADQSTTPVINVTAQSLAYGVQFTWTMLAQTWDVSGGPPAVSLKTSEVDQICGHDHVQDFRSEQDQGPSQQLYNYAVITVGTDDQAITDEARIRMDSIGSPGAFAAIDKVWGLLTAAGAS
jgi:hypothetical protein